MSTAGAKAIERALVAYFAQLGFKAQRNGRDVVIWPGNCGEISLSAIARVAARAANDRGARAILRRALPVLDMVAVSDDDARYKAIYTDAKRLLRASPLRKARGLEPARKILRAGPRA